MSKTRTILIADDDGAIVDALTMLLQMEGYEVVSTLDGTMLRRLGPDLPDLLLLDIWMSGENGKELCRLLKSQEQTRKLPIVLMSASRDVEESAREAGADAFLAKPFQMDELLETVEKLLKTQVPRKA